MTQGDATPVIGEDEVRTIARLAHLDLPPDEIRRMTGELERILAYVRQLEELDLEGVPPTAHGEGELGSMPLRGDTPKESLPHELALFEAPDVKEDGFAVPAFVDEG
jgi:aspartyl-tRNA(Asn)/glutamyl-tRNA(Gln) amidotransferase subunit C